MSFASKAAKLLTNKYVLYFVFFLAITNVFGYLVMNKLNAVIFFALIGLLMSYFSKNMIVVLGVCILATNLIMANKTLREGLENNTDTTSTTTTTPSTPPSTPTSTTTPPTPPSNKKKPPSEDPIVPIPDDAPIKDVNNMDMNKMTVEEGAPQPVVDAMTTGNKKNSKNGRIDYASTIENAYNDLDNILGGDGIKNLTQDTQKLMEKQKELFESMQSMTPMLNQAKDMLKGFDMNNLKGLASLATSFSPITPSPP